MKNVIKIWKNKGAILEGIKNNIFKKKHVEKIAEERLKICLACEFLDTKGDKCVIKKSRPCCGSCTHTRDNCITETIRSIQTANEIRY